MSMWEILDIAPTVDEKEIRRAYARQVKNIALIVTLRNISNYVKLLKKQNNMRCTLIFMTVRTMMTNL
ncbi:hypothetical protein AB6G19_21425 [Providencia manganoxydans]